MNGIQSSLASTAAPAATLSAQYPFPGLRPYQEGDAAWFFGRGREINELLKRLRRVRFLAVVGPSGCGKSSVIKAGVLAGLRDGYLDAEWRIASIRPGEQPLDNLAQELCGDLADRAAVRATLDAGSMGLVEAIRNLNLPSGTNILILVDQFEELFQFVERRGEEAREEVKAFLKLLLAAAASDDAAVYIVMTMRIEWLAECATYTGLAEAINEGIYLVPQMSRRQFQQAILGPIEAANGSIASALLDRMLNDLDGRADQLPVMQHALLRIWERRKPGEPLGIPGYEDVGTFSDCLSNHANEIFNEFSPAVKKAAEGLFRSITQVVKNRRVRRPRPLGEIAAETGQSLPQLKAVIEAFRASGRSFIVATEGELNEKSIIDISHEALIRQWGLLAKWADNEAVTQSRLRRLEDDAADWIRDREHYDGALYRGWVLHQNEELMPRVKPDSDAMAFLKASRRAERMHKAWTWGTLGLIVFLLIAGLAGGLFWFRQKQMVAASANEILKRAEQNRNNLILQLNEVASENPNLESSQAIQTLIATATNKHTVFLQYFGQQQKELANETRMNLGKEGYAVPGIEDVSAKTAPLAQTVVRYFREADREAAARCAGLLPISATGFAVSQLFPNTRSMVPAGQMEIWLGSAAALPAAGFDVYDSTAGINWAAARNDGIDYVYIQATLGGDYAVRNFKARWNNSKAAGLIRGAYHVLDNKSPVPDQIANFVRTVGPLESDDLPPLLIFSGTALDDVAAWLGGVRQKLGIRPIVMGADFKTASAASLTKLAQYPLRVSQYSPLPDAPSPWTKWTFWQFTDGDSGPFPHAVPGIGKSYRSVFNGSLADLKAFIAQSRVGAAK